MKTGELASKAGSKVETVRYYEKQGLLQRPHRNEANNYRQYDRSHLERLIFIRRCRTLDMTHDEIRAILQARDDKDKDCGCIDEIIAGHLVHVQSRIKELLALEQQLMALKDYCHADRKVDECGILRELDASCENMTPALTDLCGHLRNVHSS